MMRLSGGDWRPFFIDLLAGLGHLMLILLCACNQKAAWFTICSESAEYLFRNPGSGRSGRTNMSGTPQTNTSMKSMRPWLWALGLTATFGIISWNTRQPHAAMFGV
jgi:hypothetical protein